MVSPAKLALLVTFGIVGCTESAQRNVDTAVSVAAIDSPIPPARAVRRARVQVPRSVAELDTLLEQLRRYDGALREQNWEYDGAGGMFAALAALADSEPALADTAVVRLVACLGEPAPARAQLDGRAISMGVLCYKALSVFAYHEETGPDGELTTEWPGYLPPDPSPAQLQAVQRAWQTVVREKSYRVL